MARLRRELSRCEVVFDRLDGKAGGEGTFLGTVPTKEDLDLTGLEISEGRS